MYTYNPWSQFAMIKININFIQNFIQQHDTCTWGQSLCAMWGQMSWYENLEQDHGPVSYI